MRTFRNGSITSSALRLTATLMLAAGCLLPLTAQSAKPSESKCKAGSRDPACLSKDAGTAPGTGSKPANAPSSAADDNPFPVEDSKHGTNAHGNNFPDMPTNGVPDPPASSEKPLKLPPGGYSSSSGGDDAPGTSSSRRDDDVDVAPTTAAPDAPVKASTLKDLGSHGDTSAARARLELSRVQDDLKVGSFYMKDGNAQGAYLRFKDAVEHASDDPDARYNLAEAAAKLNKREEAILNYRECLKLDPAGDHDKASRKALQRLGATPQ